MATFVLRLNIWCLYEHYYEPDFHLLCILEFRSKTVLTILSVLFFKKTNILPGRFYEQNLLVGSFMG